MSKLGGMTKKRGTSILRNLRFPEPWYQTDKEIRLIADAEYLRGGFALSVTITLAAFLAQLIIYAQFITTQIVINAHYELDGFDCVPLTPDPSYKLRISYDDCLKIYNPPTVENLLKTGRYNNRLDGDGGANYFDNRSQMLEHYSFNGPWNWSFSNVKATGRGFAALYHRPFSSVVSNTSYTYIDQCKIPRWRGYEENYFYDPDVSFHQPLETARENARANAVNYYSSYGEFGLSNFNVSWDDYLQVVFDDQSAGQKLLKFKVNSSVSYTAHCGESFATVERDLFENKTWAFPRAWGSDYTSTFFNETTFKVDYTLRLRDKSVGITPLYPEKSSKDILGTDEYTNRNIDRTSIQCDYYEKQVAVEAYEYMYSWPNCHPCDVYKFAAPYECERQVTKSVIEILSLSVANTLAVWGIMVSAGGVLLSSSMFSGKSTGELKQDHETDAKEAETTEVAASLVLRNTAV